MFDLIFKVKTVFVVVLAFSFLIISVHWIQQYPSEPEPWAVIILALISAVNSFPKFFKSEVRPVIQRYLLSSRSSMYVRSDDKLNIVEFCESEIGKSSTLKLIQPGISNFPHGVSCIYSTGQLLLRFAFANGLVSDQVLDLRIGLENVEGGARKRTNHYFIFQKDIDKDGVPEFVFGVVDESDDHLKDVQLVIFSWHPPLLVRDLKRRENWSVQNDIVAEGVVGKPEVTLEDLLIRIPRNFQEYEYKWIYDDRIWVKSSSSY